MLGDRIKEERIKLKISQFKLGEILSVTQQAVGKWEKNLAEPDASSLKKLSELFHVTTDYLLGCNNEIFTKKNQQTVSPSTDNYTDEERRLIEGYRKLLPGMQRFIYDSVMRFTNPQENAPSPDDIKF